LTDVSGAGEVGRALLAAARVAPTSGALTKARQAIADGLAVALAGGVEPVAQIARRAAADVDGSGASLVWGTRDRVAAGAAVFLNAVAEHALGWDDYTQPMFGHCTAVLLPVCSVVADQSGASGSAVLSAYLAGYEVNGRLGEVLGSEHYDRGWHATSTIGTIGAAAAAGALLGLDDEQTWNALGLAASSAAGFQGNFGSMAKSVHAGNAARAGLAAARLAQRGVTANPNWLLGDTGYLALMGADVEKAAKVLTSERDGTLVIEGGWGLVLKPYCCCGSAQPMIRAVIELVRDHQIQAEQIRSVEVHVDPAVLTLLVYERPTTPTTARYCLPYLAAVAVLDQAAGPDQFTDASIARSDVAAVMSRVRYAADRSSPPDARYRAEVVIRTTRGTFEGAADVPEGHPRAPMSEPTLREKFGQGAGVVLPASAVDRLYGLIADLPDVPQWSLVSSLLGGP
jgi:2-methylcitrate dehydratase PrpD